MKTIERHTPLSKSILWDMQRLYYDSQGTNAWGSAVVPCFITSNSYIARTYAKITINWIMDWVSSKQSNPNEPFYIVEIGSGHGKFGFLFIREFFDLVKEYRLKTEIKYIMTDFTSSNIHSLMKHPALKQYTSKGLLDFAVFDAENGTSLDLMIENRTLDSSNIFNPMAMICNYLFDTLRHECFRILVEGKVSVIYKEKEPKDNLDGNKKLDNEENGIFPTDASVSLSNLTLEDDTDSPVSLKDLEPNILDLIDTTWEFQSVESSSYPYSAVLEWYMKTSKESSATYTFLIPIGAYSVLSTMRNLSAGKLLLLSGDKGFSHLDALNTLDPPFLAIHGSFSFMVNYHALSLFMHLYPHGSSNSKICPELTIPESSLDKKFSSKYAYTMHAKLPEGTLKLACYFTLPANSSNNIEEHFDSTVTAFTRFVDEFGPLDFFFLQNNMKITPDCDVKAMLSMIRLSSFDTDTFFKFADALVEQSPSELLLMDTVEILNRVRANFYHLDITKDVPFELARVYFALSNHFEALDLYIISSNLFGKNHVTWYNIGLTLYELGDKMGCKECCLKSLNMMPSYDRSIAWLERVNEELSNQVPLEEIDKLKIEKIMGNLIEDYKVVYNIPDYATV